MRWPVPRALRAQLAVGFLLPAVFALGALSALGYTAARGLVEDELGRRLMDAAAATAAGLSPGLVARFQPDNRRTHENLVARLERAADALGARRVFLVRPDGEAIADSAADGPAPGQPDRSLAEDRFELEQVAAGRSAASVLYADEDGVRYLRGFAPVAHEGAVVAALGVEGDAGVFRSLDALGRYLIGLTGFALAILAGLLFWFARALTAPLGRLVAAAARIGAGELDAPVPAVGQAAEVTALARTMDEMRQALLRRDRELQMMLGGIAHEVRNPLGGMELFVGLLEEDLADRPPELELLSRVKRELGQLKRVVEEFLAYARRSPVQRQPVALAELAFELAMGAGEVAVRVAAAPEAARVEADPDQLKRLLLNLIRNAGQAGATAVELAPCPGGLVVADDGPGIPAEQAARIFEAFYTTREKGTGLGLALCQRIAEAHGGSLTLENPGQPGARFKVILDATVSAPGGSGARPPQREPAS